MVQLAHTVLQTDRVVIVSDISVEDATENMRSAILRGDVKTDVLEFVGRCRNEGRLFSWSPEIDFLSLLHDPEETRVLVYFSGHGKNGAIRLPDGSFFPLERVTHHTSPRTEVVVVADCCNASTLDLPFVYSDERWSRVLPPSSRDTKRILSFTSSQHNESSYTSVHGSRFTELFCHVLELHYCITDMTRCFQAHHTQMTCAASFPEAQDLFRWMRPLCCVYKDAWGGFILDENVPRATPHPL
jgi:hypothetical protein